MALVLEIEGRVRQQSAGGVDHAVGRNMVVVRVLAMGVLLDIAGGQGLAHTGRRCAHGGGIELDDEIGVLLVPALAHVDQRIVIFRNAEHLHAELLQGGNVVACVLLYFIVAFGLRLDVRHLGRRQIAHGRGGIITGRAKSPHAGGADHHVFHKMLHALFQRTHPDFVRQQPQHKLQKACRAFVKQTHIFQKAVIEIIAVKEGDAVSEHVADDFGAIQCGHNEQHLMQHVRNIRMVAEHGADDACALAQRHKVDLFMAGLGLHGLDEIIKLVGKADVVAEGVVSKVIEVVAGKVRRIKLERHVAVHRFALFLVELRIGIRIFFRDDGAGRICRKVAGVHTESGVDCLCKRVGQADVSLQHQRKQQRARQRFDQFVGLKIRREGGGFFAVLVAHEVAVFVHNDHAGLAQSGNDDRRVIFTFSAAGRSRRRRRGKGDRRTQQHSAQQQSKRFFQHGQKLLSKRKRAVSKDSPDSFFGYDALNGAVKVAE